MSGTKLIALGFGAAAVRAFGIDLDVRVGIVVERLASLGVEARRPVNVMGVLLAGNERAVGAVERVEIAVAGGMDHKLAVLAADLGIDDRVLGDFIEIIGIVRRILVAPLDLAVRRSDRQHARRPLVVARPILRVPIRAGIADTLVESVGLRIVGRALPHPSAAVLPPLLSFLPALVPAL